MLTTALIEHRLDMTEPMLDRVYPGWHKIDPATIDIEFDCTCLLGRHAGSFNDELAKADQLGIQPEEFAGIFAPDIRDERRRKAVYAQLTAAWQRRMRGRQAREGLIAGQLPAPALLAA